MGSTQGCHETYTSFPRKLVSMPLHFSQYGYTMTLHSLYDLLYSSMDIGCLFDLVDSLTRELEIYLDPHQWYTERCLETG